MYVPMQMWPTKLGINCLLNNNIERKTWVAKTSKDLLFTTRALKVVVKKCNRVFENSVTNQETVFWQLDPCGRIKHFFPVSPAQNFDGGRCECCLWKCGEFQNIRKLSFRQKTTLNIVLANSMSNCGQSTYPLLDCLKRGKENNFFWQRENATRARRGEGQTIEKGWGHSKKG